MMIFIAQDIDFKSIFWVMKIITKFLVKEKRLAGTATTNKGKTMEYEKSCASCKWSAGKGWCCCPVMVPDGEDKTFSRETSTSSLRQECCEFFQHQMWGEGSHQFFSSWWTVRHKGKGMGRRPIPEPTLSGTGWLWWTVGLLLTVIGYNLFTSHNISSCRHPVATLSRLNNIP